MSTSLPNQSPIETTPHADIAAAQTPLDVVNLVLQNPVVAATLQKYAGKPNSLPMSIAGWLVTAIITYYGLHLNPQIVAALSFFVAALFGFAWNCFSRRFLMPPMPPPPPKTN